MTDPKPPTVEELVREAHLLTQRIPMRKIIDALATRARLADSYGAELLAILEVAKRAGGHEVTAEKAMIEMKRERDEARGEIAKQQTQIDDFARRMGADIEILKAENARLTEQLRLHHRDHGPTECARCRRALREGREGKFDNDCDGPVPHRHDR